MSRLNDFFAGSESIDQSSLTLDAAAVALGINRDRLKYWRPGEVISASNQIRVFNKIAYFSPQASAGTPVVCSDSPLSDLSRWSEFNASSNLSDEKILSSGQITVSFSENTPVDHSVFYIDGKYVDSRKLSPDDYSCIFDQKGQIHAYLTGL